MSNNVRMRLNEEQKRKWGVLCAKVDPDATYAEIVESLYEVFEANPELYERAKAASVEENEFRGPR